MYRSEEDGKVYEGREEEYPRMGFLDRPTIGTFSPAKTGDFLTGGDNWSQLTFITSIPLH
jgi:hypothetical protein